MDEVVTRAARSGLNVSCRFEGDRDRVAAPVAHLAFRVVQESLTNALRYAPGSEVRIVISVDDTERSLAVRVENDDTVHATRLWPGPGAAWSGSASGSRHSGASSTPVEPTTAGGSSKHASRPAEPSLTSRLPSELAGRRRLVLQVASLP